MDLFFRHHFVSPSKIKIPPRLRFPRLVRHDDGTLAAWQPEHIEQSLFFFLSIPCLGNLRNENVEVIYSTNFVLKKENR